MTFDVSEIRALAADLTTVGPKMVKPVLGVLDDLGAATVSEWASNARATSGEHGKHYPDSITHTARGTFGGNLEVEVGPDAGRKQGRMARGFEFGSVNQPPHLDGSKAMDAMEPRVDRALDSTIGHLIP